MSSDLQSQLRLNSSVSVNQENRCGSLDCDEFSYSY